MVPDQSQTVFNTPTAVHLVSGDHGLGHHTLLSSAPVLMIRLVIGAGHDVLVGLEWSPHIDMVSQSGITGNSKTTLQALQDVK